MKNIAIVILFMITSLASAQEANVFLDRDFWKTSPTVEVINEKIKEGNDPAALNPFAFDGVVYAMLEKAPNKTIKYLLEMEGNPVNKVTHDGRNYLMWAAYKGNLELMEYLIEKGSDTKLIDDHGYNLITFAAVAGQQDTAVYDLILKHDGKITDTNREGANCLLLLAPHMKDEKIITYFTDKGLDMHDVDHEGNGIFSYAAKKGNINMMNKFIEMGVEYANINKNGGNAMMFASYGYRRYFNPLNVYQHLEKLGVHPNVLTDEGKTPLHSIAFRTKDYSIFEYFMESGVDVNQKDTEGNTAFLNAVRGRNYEIAEKLLPLVDDINYTNKKGYSAATFAIMRNADDFLTILLNKGADLKVVDAKGNNLGFHAFDSFSKKNSNIFEQHIDLLKSKDIDLLSKQSGGNTLLHLAAGKGEKYLVEKAIGLKININSKNDDGLTALHLAAMKAKDEKLLAYLIEKGADKSILTDFEESAFDLANENELLTQGGISLEFLK